MDQLYFVVHTHWDREWYQPFQQMRARLVAMADRMIPNVERGTIPSFHFDGQTIVLEDYLELRPEAERRLRKLIRAGKIQVGPWYVLADSFLVSGESLIRNLEIGIAQARRFGRPLGVGYIPDQFGHIAQMPQILAGFGLKTAVLWRGVGNDVNRSRFVWEAPDGTSVLTIYLSDSYSNGANLPLESVESFLSRADEIAGRGRTFADGAPILVMTGTDHAEPDSRLMERINQAREISPMTFEVGPLEPYVHRIEAMPLNGTPHHRGELRSPLRTHLLPGCTSARTWIKQRDFENCIALERLADPLAALANSLGRGGDLEAFLNLAWRTEIQNHPHDSICGCSVDQVHTDMRYRFDQAAMVADNVIRRASAACLSGTSGAPSLAVFNPTFSRRTLVTGNAHLPDPEASYAAVAADGSRYPIVADIARAGRAFDIELPVSDIKSMIGGLSQASMFGFTLDRYEVTRPAEGPPQVTLYISRASTSDLDLDELRHAIRTQLPDSGTVRIHAVDAARCRLSFVADNLAQAGFSVFRLERDDSAAPKNAQPAANSIENAFYRLTQTSRGLEILDLKRNASMELYFEDDGDRGDEYNYDPVPGDRAIAAPASISARVTESGPVRSRMIVTMAFDLPAAVARDRQTRSADREKLEIELIATLHAGLERVDFSATITNRSKDHRIRAALRTPVAAADAVQDTSFGIVRRPLQSPEPPGMEDFYPAAPHRTFTAVEGPEFSVALASRGIYECEVRRDGPGSTILLTLLRCIGWLSRSDLSSRRGGAGPELSTPGAQELGTHHFEFSVTSFRGSHLEGDLLQRLDGYAAPPRLFLSRGILDSAGLSLAECDNPRIIFSTARPLERTGTYKVRAFSASPERERVRFAFGGRRAKPIDLAGGAVKRDGLKRSRGGLALEMRPFEIVTFEVRNPGGA
ncbi:MAG TPA: glycoside hydrolase family 38 C-terminal domain-containing protein [Candidatus Binataceae bacterium]|nr:glycoside hydrolase family 38 C-terminal domain-containing protein [Candidatus Binataceae bacterium]